MTTELYIDDLTNNIMDEIRDVLKKYKQHIPEWNNEDLDYNLDDRIYHNIHREILYATERRKTNNNNHTHN